ncbi:Hypothetical protein A7982_03010 [Minicystis rosea]|nr:Hypothetical protein A7982_03010 [Minicystis rosea]
MLFVLAVAVPIGCGGDPASTSGGTSTETGSGGSGGSHAMVDRGPTSIVLDGDPNGLFWDAPTGTLYIADNHNNRVLQWTDAAGIGLVADLPGGAQNSAGLGQLVKAKDGTIAVTIFGFGATGGVAFIAPDKSTGMVPSLDPVKRRIGLAIADDGTLYDSYFENITGSKQIGAIARLDLAGAETDVVTSLKKPVGLLAAGSNLIISDQTSAAVLVAPIASPTNVTTLAQLDGPDLLSAGPNGTYFTGGSNGEVRRIASDGTVSTFAGGFIQIRGVAYDAQNKRLFAAEHDPEGTKSALRILPVD